jgi:hypothetical protein
MQTICGEQRTAKDISLLVNICMDKMASGDEEYKVISSPHSTTNPVQQQCPICGDMISTDIISCHASECTGSTTIVRTTESVMPQNTAAAQSVMQKCPICKCEKSEIRFHINICAEKQEDQMNINNKEYGHVVTTVDVTAPSYARSSIQQNPHIHSQSDFIHSYDQLQHAQPKHGGIPTPQQVAWYSWCILLYSWQQYDNVMSEKLENAYHSVIRPDVELYFGMKKKRRFIISCVCMQQENVKGTATRVVVRLRHSVAGDFGITKTCGKSIDSMSSNS